jgi:hypothetical protein
MFDFQTYSVADLCGGALGEKIRFCGAGNVTMQMEETLAFGGRA